MIILAASGKRSVHKGVIQPNFCILWGILMCVPFFGLSSTRLHVFDREEIRSFAGISCANFLLSKKVDFSDMSKFPHYPLPAAEMKYAQG